MIIVLHYFQRKSSKKLLGNDETRVADRMVYFNIIGVSYILRLNPLESSLMSMYMPS